MYSFDTYTSAKQFWLFPGDDFPVEAEGNTYSGTVDGIRYSCTITREDPVVLRQDSITNTTDKAVTVIPFQTKFQHAGSEFEVYTQSNFSLLESQGGWQPLITKCSATSGSLRVNCSAAPFLALWDLQTQRGTAFHLLTNSTWEIAAHKASLRSNITCVQVLSGFQNCPPITIEAGQTIQLPGVLFYEFRNKLDMDAWKLHRWFNTYHPRKVLPILYNTWLYHFDHFTPELIEKQIPVAAELGLEYFVIDAGWFGEKGRWWLTVGDWYESEASAMENKMDQIAAKVRQHGMKFGLWLEIERCSETSQILKDHPEYFTPGMPGEKSWMLNFALPEARQYLHKTIDGLIAKYGIEFIKFDFNVDLYHMEGDPAFVKYFQGYRQFIDELSANHPEVYLGNCASGGYRMDINNALQFGSFWLSDNQSPYHTTRIYKDTLRRLPPQVIERWATILDMPEFPQKHKDSLPGKILATDDSRWKHVTSVDPSWMECFLTGPAIGFSCDVASFRPELKEQFKAIIAQVKENREYWSKAECRILADTTRLLTLEYTDPDFTRIEIAVYLWEFQQSYVKVYPVVDVNARYLLDGVEYTGKELDENGIKVPMSFTRTAKHLVLTKI